MVAHTFNGNTGKAKRASLGYIASLSPNIINKIAHTHSNRMITASVPPSQLNRKYKAAV